MMNLNINKFWKKRSVTITDYDPTYKVVYLGNVLTAWAKGEGCVDKPLATLWKNYCQNVKPDVYMKVTVCNSGLKAETKEHGLTEYWSHRVTFCGAHPQYPRVFCWVYRHEGKKLRQELRCHAVLCGKEDMSRRMAAQLQQKLAQALQEFKREKICRQNARLSLANSVYDNPSLPRRKILLSTGSVNYRPPLERSKSAPKLMVIEEAGEGVDEDAEEAERRKQQRHQRQFSQLLEERLMLHQRRQRRLRIITDEEELEDKDDNENAFQDGADLDDVILLDPILEQDSTSLDMYPEEEECDEGLMSETYTTNPMATSVLRGLDDNDDMTPTPPSSTSASSSPSSVREGRLQKNSNNDEDNISDESGYSEDNGVHTMAGRTYMCSI